LWISTPNTVPVEDYNNQSNPTVAVIGGQRLIVAGGADGWIYALQSRTGQPVWRFHFSRRSLNSPPTVVGDTVYASQGEEPLDGAFMGQVAAIDGTGSGDVTATHRLWHADAITGGFAAPLYHDGRLYVVDNSANIHALDAKTGAKLYDHNLGTVGRGSPVFADGKIYATEVNGGVHILAPRADRFELLDSEHLRMPEGRHTEIWGSLAPAYGRIYFIAEDGIYCLGDEKVPFQTAAAKPAAAARGEEPAPAGSEPALLQVVPAEIMAAAAEDVRFEAKLFDAKGRALAAPPAGAVRWSLAGLEGTLSSEGVLRPAAGRTQTGKVEAALGELRASALTRFYAPLPWSEDFESGELPGHWVAAARFRIAEEDGNKTLHKAPAEVGLNRGHISIGPATMTGYTIEADLRAKRRGRRMPDIGLVNAGYTLDMQGNHQRLQIRCWASELAFSHTIPFAWEADVWYRMKLRVDVEADKSVVRGKVWKKAEREPDEWTIQWEDPGRIPAGAPGIYGDSSVNLDSDNLSVVVNR
jgi:hypothetical protein